MLVRKWNEGWLSLSDFRFHAGVYSCVWARLGNTGIVPIGAARSGFNPFGSDGLLTELTREAVDAWIRHRVYAVGDSVEAQVVFDDRGSYPVGAADVPCVVVAFTSTSRLANERLPPQQEPGGPSKVTGTFVTNAFLVHMPKVRTPQLLW